MRKLGEVFGALTLVGGLTWVLLNLHGPAMVPDLLVGAVVALGGLVLLMPHRLALPGRLTALVAAVVALAGTAAGLLHRTGTVGGMFTYVERLGWPFHWLSRGATAPEAETARHLAAGMSWQPDVVAIAADLLFWAYAGMLVVALVTGLRRAQARAVEAGVETAVR